MSDDGLFDRFARRSQSAAGRLRVRSALNPILWLCAIVSMPCFGAAPFLGGSILQSVVIVIGAVPVATACAGFVYFLRFAPEKLQSEEYQIRHEAIELIRQKGTSISISPASIEAIANPIRDSER
jgi:hypothetical protein